MITRRFVTGQSIVFLSVVLVTGACFGTMRTVPQEYSTIQAAFDAVNNGDTVFVAPGIYAEALIAPSRFFVLKGNTILDTGDYPRPVVDPSTLSNPRSRRCLWLPAGSRLIIEDFVFRNGSEMYPHSGGWGGIEGNSDSCALRRCILDSTYGGFVAQVTASLVLDSCQFLRNQVLVTAASHLIARDCLFNGRGGELIWAGPRSQFVRCEIRGDSAGHLLNLWGDGIVVRDCIIGPGGSSTSSPLISAQFQGIIENCLFHGCHSAVAVIQVDFNSEVDTSYIRGNHFIGNENMRQILAQCYGSGYPCFAAVIENNVFEDLRFSFDGAALDLRDDAIVQWNRFSHIRPGNGAAVIANGPFSELRYNFFDSTGFAATTAGSVTLDALHNWWGHESGPYNLQWNPNGRGDSVSNSVHFDPWLTDTSDLRSTPHYRPEAAQFAMNAYPNPFNSTVRIRLSLAEPRIVELEMFDLLGRRVREQFVGPVPYEQDVMVAGDDLPSGIYFLRMRDTVRKVILAQTKLVQIK